MSYTISNKYTVIEQIGEGAFGKVFLGKHIKTDQNIAIKIQFKSVVNVLQHEAKIYKQLFDISGIPLLRNYGCDKGFHYLIIDKLDYTIDKLILKNSEIINFFINSINIIEEIHKKGILHRDIKPDNFMIKERNGEQELFMIDFGLSKRYLSLDGNHIDYKKDKNIIGTIKYASINIHKGEESSRRDDIESLVYTFISLYGTVLPWSNLCEKLNDLSNKNEIIDEIFNKKNKIDELLLKIPTEFITILLYSRSLSFHDKPNYNYIKNILSNLLNIIK